MPRETNVYEYKLADEAILYATETFEHSNLTLFKEPDYKIFSNALGCILPRLHVAFLLPGAKNPIHDVRYF